VRDTALAELYARQAPAARRLAYLLTGDTLLAEDIVQDCFVKLASRLRPIEDPEPYLRRMVVNASHSHHRKLRVRRDRARDEAATERARLLAALDVLPPRQRSAVVLRHWLDLSEQQCADELGCSVGTVKSLASRGRAALRLSLENA
jgi:RNA polymerase sigma-70 factor (sigma-E family)